MKAALIIGTAILIGAGVVAQAQQEQQQGPDYVSCAQQVDSSNWQNKELQRSFEDTAKNAGFKWERNILIDSCVRDMKYGHHADLQARGRTE